MNVIVCNKKAEMLNNLNIDIIKKVQGEYEVDELVNMFKNFYYQRMILDITAIKNYSDIRNLQKLALSLDMEKVILLLDDNGTIPPDYLSKLISMGLYNFTRNLEGVLYLYNNPNSYRDVAQYHQLDNQNENEKIVYQTADVDFCRIIGVKSLTKESGATTFSYLMVKQLKKNYDVVGVEVDKSDFIYFNDKSLFNVSSNALSKFIEENRKKDAIIIDIGNNPTALGLVQEVIYLVEPSVLKLNMLLNTRKNVFKDLEGKKIVLNQSLLSSKEVLELQYEARTKFFFNMPPLNERDNDIMIMDTFLSKLGFSKQHGEENEKRKKILGIF